MLAPNPSKAPPEEIERVADELGASSMIVEHQIDNQLQTRQVTTRWSHTTTGHHNADR